MLVALLNAYIFKNYKIHIRYNNNDNNNNINNNNFGQTVFFRQYNNLQIIACKYVLEYQCQK